MTLCTLLAVKFFTSVKWQAKFTDVAQQFATHKDGIAFDLQLQASVGIAAATVSLAAVGGWVAQLNDTVARMMELVFARMRSPEERELAALVGAQPGGAEAVLKDERLLQEVLKKVKTGQKEEGGMRRPGQGPQEKSEGPLTPEALKAEVKKGVDQIMEENRFFEQKFEAMRAQVDEVKVVVRHESDRVIDAVLAGPHERIVDKVNGFCTLVRRSMLTPMVGHVSCVERDGNASFDASRSSTDVSRIQGWKGSTKAKHLVMALRDHFAESSVAALSVIRDITTQQGDADSEAAEKVVKEVREIANRVKPDDQWALRYITVLRVQPLIEALDDDVSSFVTVSEVNAFTAARPAEWRYGLQIQLFVD